MPDTSAAIWSAVAASFAALSSFLIMLIQRRSLLESVRPELVLTGWSRSSRGQGHAAHEVIAFQTIRNVGRGPALQVFLVGFHAVCNNRPTATCQHTRLPILASNEATDVNGEILLFWKNVEAEDQAPKNLTITVAIVCRDSRGMRHETRYHIFALESPNVGMADGLAPGVTLLGRRSTTIPMWLLKLSRGLARIPGLGRLFRNAT